MGLRLIYAFKLCHCHSLSPKVENTVPPPGIAPMARPLGWEALRPCGNSSLADAVLYPIQDTGVSSKASKQALSFLSLQLSLFKPAALQLCIYFISDGSFNKVINSEIIHFYSGNIQEKACEKWGWRFSTNTLSMQKKNIPDWFHEVRENVCKTILFKKASSHRKDIFTTGPLHTPWSLSSRNPPACLTGKAGNS